MNVRLTPNIHSLYMMHYLCKRRKDFNAFSERTCSSSQDLSNRASYHIM